MAPKNVSIRRYAGVAPPIQVLCQVDNHETSAYYRYHLVIYRNSLATGTGYVYRVYFDPGARALLPKHASRYSRVTHFLESLGCRQLYTYRPIWLPKYL